MNDSFSHIIHRANTLTMPTESSTFLNYYTPSSARSKSSCKMLSPISARSDVSSAHEISRLDRRSVKDPSTAAISEINLGCFRVVFTDFAKLKIDYISQEHMDSSVNWCMYQEAHTAGQENEKDVKPKPATTEHRKDINERPLSPIIPPIIQIQPLRIVREPLMVYITRLDHNNVSVRERKKTIWMRIKRVLGKVRMTRQTKQ